jgi:cbb3-type cytochrome oxidase maturation protein
MEVLILTTFVSVSLAAAGVGLFVWSVRARTFDHTDRLAILPLEDAPDASPPLAPASFERSSSTRPVEKAVT